MTASPEPELESRYRSLTRPWRLAVRLLLLALPAIAIAYAFSLPSYFGFAIWDEQIVLAVLACALAASLLSVPAGNGPPPVTEGRPPLLDIVLAVLVFAVSLRNAYYYESLIASGYLGVAAGNWMTLGCSLVLLVLTLEAVRRLTGWTLVILVLAFIAYGLVAEYIPGPIHGRSSDLDTLLIYLSVDSSALVGTPVKVVVSTVSAFILFGTALFRIGGGQLFIDLALALMGRFRGGAAKAAILGSSLFGSISGSAVANVVTTGVVTIPLMKRNGFSAERAAAVEAVASTGGQIVPPVMGAAAFIMADFLGISYSEVALAAIAPAVIFYFALFVQVHLAALRIGLPPMPLAERPSLGKTLKTYWPFLIPFAVLVYILFFTGQRPAVAALIATAVTILVAFISPANRPRPGDILHMLEETGRGLLSITLVCAAAGLVIGILSVTGLGFSLGLTLVQASSGNLVLLLLIAALTSLVLGMGMPTTAVYVLMAALAAPALIKAGIHPVAAHLFILYYGCLSSITPPICFASFAAAAISGSNMMRTGLASARQGIIAFVLPFLFVSAPALLFQSDAVGESVRIVATGLVGSVLLVAALEGYLFGRATLVARLLLGASGVALMLPDQGDAIGLWSSYSDIAGLALLPIALAAAWFGSSRKVSAPLQQRAMHSPHEQG